MALETCGSTTHLDPRAVIRVLEEGSWIEADWLRHWWAGLLATSCSTGANPERKFVSLLSQFTNTQARIFAGACSLAAKFAGGPDRTTMRPIVCSAKDLVKIAQTHDRVRIERDILHLVELGLIEKSVKWRFFSLLDQAVITPTQLALDLHACCHGRCEDVRKQPAEFAMSIHTIAAD